MSETGNGAKDSQSTKPEFTNPDGINCMACQMCCRSIAMPVNRKQIGEKERIKHEQFVEWAKAYGIQFFKWRKQLWMMYKLECQHIDWDKGCLIYEDRPRTCRQFQPRPLNNPQCYIGCSKLVDSGRLDASVIQVVVADDKEVLDGSIIETGSDRPGTQGDPQGDR